MRVLILILCVGLSGCVHQPPYELKSPCVSGDSDNLELNNPCIRKPINRYLI
jgi:hypothetical protein